MTKEEEEDWIELYQTGISIREIAKQYHASPRRVSCVIQKVQPLRSKQCSLEIASAAYSAFQQGRTRQEIAGLLNISATTVSRLLARHYQIEPVPRKRPLEVLGPKLVAAYEEGHSGQEIARAYGVSTQTVFDYLKRANKKSRTLQEANQNEYIQSDYFQTMTPAKAYQLGIIWGSATMIRQYGTSELDFFFRLPQLNVLTHLQDNWLGHHAITLQYPPRTDHIRFRLATNHVVQQFEVWGIGKHLPICLTNVCDIHQFWKGFVQIRHRQWQRGSYIRFKAEEQELKTSFLEYWGKIGGNTEECLHEAQGILVRKQIAKQLVRETFFL